MNARRPPPALRGFEHVHRYHDQQSGAWVARILPGEYYVTGNGEVVSTVLGSCVGACLWDPVAGIAGMNHFMLPETDGPLDWGSGATAATRYGSYAMECLINDMLRAGALRHRLEAKLFGGARMLRAGPDIGARNIEFVYRYLAAERLPILAEDLGGDRGRKVVLAGRTGKVRVRLVGESPETLARAESRLRSALRERSGGGDVELFT